MKKWKAVARQETHYGKHTTQPNEILHLGFAEYTQSNTSYNTEVLSQVRIS